MIHGYDYQFIRAPDYRNRHGTWVKVPMIKEALKTHETVVFLDADAVFYFTYASNDPATAEEEAGFVTELEQNPLWRSLGAVRSGRAYRVGGYWWRAQTYLLANRVLDDLFTHLAGTEADTPVLALP